MCRGRERARKKKKERERTGYKLGFDQRRKEKKKKEGGRWKACGLRRDRATSTATNLPRGSRFGFGRGNGVIDLNVGTCTDVNKKKEEVGEMKRIKDGFDK